MKLSVIIPVYRVADTLDRCVGSVLSQPFSDFEVILVDDGSPDESPQLCDQWAGTDSRVRVIHQPNGGLSAARNTGIGQARGDYLTFIDSDDFIGPDTLPAVLDDTADIVEYPVCRHYGSRRSSPLNFADRYYTDVADYWLSCRAYTHAYACNKIYRRQLFDDVRFPAGKVYEDVYTLPRLLSKHPLVRTTSCGRYYYCENPRGITATATGPQLRQLLDAYLTSGMPMDDSYYLYLLNIQADVCEQAGDDVRLPFRRVRSCAPKAIIQNLLGIKRLCHITKLLHRIRPPRS